MLFNKKSNAKTLVMVSLALGMSFCSFGVLAAGQSPVGATVYASTTASANTKTNQKKVSEPIQRTAVVNDNTINTCFNVIDLYGHDGKQTYMEFTRAPDALSRLKSFNKALNENYTYLEFSSQTLEKLGYYKGEEKFAIKIGQQLVNNKVDIEVGETYLTYLKAVQLGKNGFSSLEDYILEGRYFNENDFNVSKDSVIPVVLGYEYCQAYKLNDTFTMNYLNRKSTFEVVGFLQKDASITKNYGRGAGDFILNEYICMPHFDIQDAPKDEGYAKFQRYHYTQKNSGFVAIPDGTKGDYEKYRNEVEQLAKTNNLEYSIAMATLSVGVK